MPAKRQQRGARPTDHLTMSGVHERADADAGRRPTITSVRQRDSDPAFEAAMHAFHHGTMPKTVRFVRLVAEGTHKEYTTTLQDERRAIQQAIRAYLEAM